MNKQPIKIGVVAPACRLNPAAAEKVHAIAAESYTGGRVEIMIHPQCYLSDGHFAGDDKARAAAFLEVANDPSVDAVWFARGGYGACRILEAVIPHLAPAATAKTYLGYSDLGSLLGALYRQGFAHLAHGPMVMDARREGGEAAVRRALSWLVDRDPAALEPSLAPARRRRPSTSPFSPPSSARRSNRI
jgi:muramoyltetrapeptide carboxypeptidase